ncbi:MAG: ABC transporter substrate-binding protein [Alphaproteobacteria bacterium]
MGADVAVAAKFKVLVVMSYEEENPWVREIREGIDSTLGTSGEITYFYMNTKVNRDGGPEKAREAYALFQKLKPDGVIAADDDAQTMFVVPYLKDKVTTPVMFNGVNAAAEKYGFPNSHVSGVLERAHVRESLAFIKQLMPAIQTVCFITNNVPAGLSLRTQVVEEKETYPAKANAFHLVNTTGELEALSGSLRTTCDALFVDSLEGITDGASTPLKNKDVLKVLSGMFSGPILGGNRYQVEQGAWAAVIKTGQEQGETSAEMLLKAMRGTPVASIPVVRNTRGQRVINVTAIESHGVALRPIVLRGATLIRQQP